MAKRYTAQQLKEEIAEYNDRLTKNNCQYCMELSQMCGTNFLYVKSIVETEYRLVTQGAPKTIKYQAEKTFYSLLQS